MNIGTLKNQMHDKAIEWRELFNEDGETASVGAIVASWRIILEKVTDKLVNPRKTNEAELQMLLAEANRTVEELRTQYENLKGMAGHQDYASGGLDSIDEFHKRADDGEHKRS